MMNSRSKTLKPCFSQASMKDDSDDESGAVIGSNDELLTEILIRLPVTSILRFKSVSKHWRSLLSEKHFTRRYDDLSKSPPGLFSRTTYVPFDVENNPSTPRLSNLDFFFDGVEVSILQSCNGLLLCCTINRCYESHKLIKYYLFNPTTRKLATIPSLPGGLKVGKSICFMGLAYHLTDCVHYKLVCIRILDLGDKLFQIQIYSSDTRKWEISVESFSACTSVFHQGVYWNGGVYWAPFLGNYLYFKIDVEQLQTLPLPEGLVASEIWPMYFGESRGHLHLILYKKRSDDSLPLNVYEMLSDHSGWFVKYQVQVHELPGVLLDRVSRFRPPDHHFRVIDVVRGDEEEEEDTFLVLISSNRMITYNVHEKSFKQIRSLTFGLYTDYSNFHRYTKALSPF